MASTRPGTAARRPSTRERHRRAYEAGYRGEPAPEWADDTDTLAHYDRGLQDADDPGGAGGSPGPAAPPRRRTPTRTSSTASGSSGPSSSDAATADWLAHTRKQRAAAAPDRVGDPSSSSGLGGRRLGGSLSVDDGSGFLLGLLGFALVRAFLEGGTAEARGWLSAKFLNKVTWTGALSSAGTTAPAAPGYVLPKAAAPVDTTPAPPWTPTTPSTAMTAPIARGVAG